MKYLNDRNQCYVQYRFRSYPFRESFTKRRIERGKLLLLQENRSLSKISRFNAFSTPNELEMLTFTCSKIEPTCLSMLSCREIFWLQSSAWNQFCSWRTGVPNLAASSCSFTALSTSLVSLLLRFDRMLSNLFWYSSFPSRSCEEQKFRRIGHTIELSSED